MPKTDAQHAKDISRTAPALSQAQVGQVVLDLLATTNALVADLTALRTKYNAVLAKLDADGGVTATDFAATQAMAAPTAKTVPTFANR